MGDDGGEGDGEQQRHGESIQVLRQFNDQDQRGGPRKSGAHVDIGAYEVSTNVIVVNTNDGGVVKRRVGDDAVHGAIV